MNIKKIDGENKNKNNINVHEKNNYVNIEVQNNFKNGKFNKNEKEPEVSLSTQTRVLQLKNELERVEQALVAKREEHEKQMKEFKKRKDLLEDKRMKVKKNYIHFNNYFEEMKEKKEKAFQRIDESKGIREQRDLEIIRLYEDIEKLMERKNTLKNKTKKWSKFECYLQKVASLNPEEFPEVSDVIRKTDTLVNTRNILIKNQSENLAELKNSKECFSNYVQTKKDEVLYLNLELVELRKKLEKIQNKKLLQEKNCIETSLTFDENFVAINNIIRTTENLEKLTEKNKRSLKEQVDSTKTINQQTSTKLTKTEQMIKVIWNMIDMADIVKEYKTKT